MTFIGIACKGDSAEIVTDTVGYSNEGARFRQTSKQQRFDHLGAVVLTSGNGRVAKHAEWHADFAANNADDFDEMVDAVPHWYEYALRDADFDRSQSHGMPGTICLVGYSGRLGEYAAFTATTHDLTPKRITGVHLQPMTYRLRPSPTQLKDFVRGLRAYEVPSEDIETTFANLRSRPLPPMPQSDEDWIALAEMAREDRSLQGPFMRVWIAGHLTHTRLASGVIESRTIHHFDDVGELDQLVVGSLHPVAQIAPCTDCDSGRPAVECCLPEHYAGRPCDCGGPDQKPFEDCCMVRDPNSVQRVLWSPSSPYGNPAA